MGDIFLKLLNMSITAGWLILAVLCIRVLFKKMPKWIHCLLWGVVAVRLMVPFSIESAFSLLPSAEPIQSSSMAEGEIVPYVPSIDSNLPMVENTVNPLLAKTFAYEESDSAAPLQVVTGIAGSVWLSGMIALLLFAIGSVIRLHLLVRTAIPYKKQIFICDEVSFPFILGLFRPRVYLSSAMERDEMNYVIAHEKAHLRRKDHLWKPLGYLILCVYWFHPLCWVAYIMLCKDIELACDEKVIKNMSFANRKEYSRVLLSCASQRRLVFSCPLAFGEVGVKERVKSVLKYKKPAFFITLVAVMLCVVVAVCFLTNPAKTYQIRVTVPAGSTAAFCYSEEEISPKGNTLTLANGEGLGDTEVILLPVEVREENAYEPAYMTPGMPVKMDVEKGAWFKIGVNVQNPTAEDKDFYVSVKNVEVRIASEEISESENSMYGEIVAGLGDEEAYAFLSMDYGYDVLLTTDLIYDAGTEQQAAVSCDVYYPVDDEVKKLGSILSDGTAYPLTFTKDGIFAASGHKIEKYGISEEGTLYLEKGVYEQFDEAGNATYIRMTGDQESPSTEAEYQELVNAYGSSQIVHFSYGAAGSVNEYQEMEAALEVKEQTPDTGDEGVFDELVRVVSSVGLKNAYPWSNTVELKENADALIRMASDETGRFEIYGIMSAKYGTYGLLLNDWTGGQENWNFAYVPWEYTGTPSGQPILESDGNGKYVFAYIDQYEDGVPWWEECILDCGYDTGHMELLTPEEYNAKWGEELEEETTENSGENTGNTAAGTMMVDATEVASIEIINGNSGERKSLTAEDAYYEYPDMGNPQAERAVNTLEHVTMTMMKYKSWEGEIEITNQTDRELQTGPWYEIQKLEDGVWQLVETRVEIVLEDLAYRLPAGETTVFPTNWKGLYGELPSGEYRVIKYVSVPLADRIETHYLAAEFEIP